MNADLVENVLFSTFFNDSYLADLSNPASPFRLRITDLLVARRAAGRDEALRIRPHPAGVKGVSKALASQVPFRQNLQVPGSERSGGSAPAAGPSHFHLKI